MNGKLLTAEQSQRLALMDSLDRQKFIEAIAAHLRFAGRRCGEKNSPRDWYSMTVKERS